MPTPDELKNNREVQKQPESPEAKAQAAGAVLQQKREKQAADALIGAEEETAPQETEKNPDQQAREIAERHIQAIPEGDRKITDKEQLEILLYALENTDTALGGGSGLTSTTDKLGNLPRNILEALNQNENGSHVVKMMKEWADDPVSGAATMDKVRNIAQSTLPESVRDALLTIILTEGEHSAQQAMRVTADRIEHAISDEDISSIIQKAKKGLENGGVTSKEADDVRRTALKQFLEGVYPDIIQAKEVQIINELREVRDNEGFEEKDGESWDDRKKRRNGVVRENARRLAEHMGDKKHNDNESFSDLQSRLIDESMQRIVEKGAKKEEGK